MRTALSYVLTLSIALWLGGLVTLLMSLMAIFKEDRELGSHVGPILFSTFEPYQLGLAAVSTLAAILWRIGTKSVFRKLVLVLLMLASVLSIVEHTVIMPRIVQLWQQKNEREQRAMQQLFTSDPRNPTTQTLDAIQDPAALEAETAQFQKMHQASRYLYTSITIMVLLAGLTTVSVLQNERPLTLPRPTDRD